MGVRLPPLPPDKRGLVMDIVSKMSQDSLSKIEEVVSEWVVNEDMEVSDIVKIVLDICEKEGIVEIKS